MESCYYQIIEKLPWNPVVYLEPNDWGSVLKLLRVILIEISGSTDWKDRAALRQGFLDHNEGLRSTVPKEKFLEFRVEEGWEPLCQFLGKPVPSGPFPRVNEGNASADLTFWGARVTLRNIFKQKVLPVLVAILAVVVGWISWRIMVRM